MINEITKINESLYAITECNSTIMYFVIGKEKALLIDTGYGYQPVAEALKKLTNKEILVVLTHGHPDHGLGSYQFSKVMIHPDDIPRLKEDDNPEMKQMTIDYRKTKIPALTEEMDVEAYLNTTLDHTQFLSIKEGDKIDLGEIVFDIYEIPGHSNGSIALVEKSKKWAFTGDTITKYNIWNHCKFPEYVQPFSILLQSYRKMEKILDADYLIYPAHGEKPITTYIIKELENALFDLVERYEDDQIIHTFIGDCYLHDYRGRKILYSKELLQEALNNGLE